MTSASAITAHQGMRFSSVNFRLDFPIIKFSRFIYKIKLIISLSTKIELFNNESYCRARLRAFDDCLENFKTMKIWENDGLR